MLAGGSVVAWRTFRLRQYLVAVREIRLRGCDVVLTVRRFRESDAPLVWALCDLIKIGDVADPDVPLALPGAIAAPLSFGYLADIPASFMRAGGDFMVAELDSQLVGTGGIRRTGDARAEVKAVRVHPATRRMGVGRALMTALERRAAELGIRELHLDTLLEEPASIAFYDSLGYEEVRREWHTDWALTLVYYQKLLKANTGRG